MTQNPYAGSGFDDAIGEPPRTSVTAVLSLVFSLIGCCLPVGLLGSLLGVFALMGISRSRGRVTGKGLAIAGLIIGLVTTAIWLGAYFAVQKGVGVYSQSTGAVLADIEAGDYDAARGAMNPATTITDEQFDAFRAAYTAELGAFQNTPEGIIEIFQTFIDPAVGQHMQDPAYQGGNDRIPAAGIFDQSPALVIFSFDPANPGSGAMPAYTDITIVLPDGTELKLAEPLPAPVTPDGGG